MDQNSHKGSQKDYSSLPFAVKVSVRLSFKQFCVDWISDKEAFRIIQSHHVIKHADFKQSKGFLTACRNTAFLLHFLTFWNSWLRQQISETPTLYKVLLSFCWHDVGKQAVERKAECFKVWRLFLFPLLFHSNMHYWPSVRWSIWLDILPNSFFCILLDFLKVLYFFPGWLCHETSSLAARPNALKLASITFKNLWKVDL